MKCETVKEKQNRREGDDSSENRNTRNKINLGLDESEPQRELVKGFDGIMKVCHTTPNTPGKSCDVAGEPPRGLGHLVKRCAWFMAGRTEAAASAGQKKDNWRARKRHDRARASCHHETRWLHLDEHSCRPPIDWIGELS